MPGPSYSVKIDINEVVDNAPEVMAAIKQIATREILVGYLEGKQQSDLHNNSTLTNAAIAYIQDRGSPGLRIPPRPFMEPGVRSVENTIITELKQGAKKAMEGDASALEKSLTGAGVAAQAGIQMYMTTGTFVPLAPYTISRRRSRGFMGTRPLIETGQLRAAVKFTVTNKRRRSP